MIEITVNGETREIASGASLAALIEALGFDPRTVAALCNDVIVERDLYELTSLQPGDIVELVRFVPGG